LLAALAVVGLGSLNTDESDSVYAIDRRINLDTVTVHHALHRGLRIKRTLTLVLHGGGPCGN
jgi:hypothetical protein